MRIGLIFIGLLSLLLSVNVSCSRLSRCRCASLADPDDGGLSFEQNSKIVFRCSDYGRPEREIYEGESSDLESIYIRGCNGSTLDPRIPKIFKNLQYYQIENLGLESLSPDDLRFDNLQNFQASNNKLTLIPVGLFAHAPRLHTINLGDNKIATLAPGAFSEVSDFGWLNLEGNPMRYFDGKIVLPICYRFAECRLPWENVEEFDISHMSDMFNFSVEGWWFEYGQTGVLRVRSFRADGLENLKVFNASGTPIGHVARLFQYFGPSMKALDVSSSSLEHLNGTAFDRFANLQYLNLSNTNLSSFDFDDLQNLTQLEVLDISHNDLNKIHFSSDVESFPKLETLNFIGNHLTEIDFVKPTMFPKLISLGISQNQFTCSYLKEFLGQWPDLEVFNNNSANQRNVRGIDCLDN